MFMLREYIYAVHFSVALMWRARNTNVADNSRVKRRRLHFKWRQN